MSILPRSLKNTDWKIYSVPDQVNLKIIPEIKEAKAIVDEGSRLSVYLQHNYVPPRFLTVIVQD